eukprot:645438-Alexandrium_andersonii.AAC.1
MDLVPSSNRVIVPWMSRHSAWLIARYQKRDSGAAAFQEARGSPYTGVLVQLGECVVGCVAEAKGGKLTSPWVQGVWLGRPGLSDEHLLGREDGVLKVRSIRRLAKQEDAWGKDLFGEIKGGPRNAKGAGRAPQRQAASADP